MLELLPVRANQSILFKCRNMIINAILVGLCISATVIEGQRGISPVIISGTNDGCPSDDSRQAARSFLQNATREIINLNTLQ